MSYIAPPVNSRKLFRNQCYELTDNGLYEEEMNEALNTVVIKCFKFFTVDIQPFRIDDKLVYAITQYGSEDIILIHDEDFPDLELSDWCSSNLLPLGFRKAAAISETLHADNIKKFGITENEDTKKYSPKEPYQAYLKSIGQSKPFVETTMTYIEKIVNSKSFDVMISVLGYAIAFAIGGAVLAIFTGFELTIYMFLGAFLGVFYYLIFRYPRILVCLIIALVAVIILCWQIRSWNASSLAKGLTEFVRKQNPLDEFGMTAKVSNSWEYLDINILSKEQIGKSRYDNNKYESKYDFKGYNGIKFGHTLKNSAAVFLLSSYLKSLPEKKSNKIINELTNHKIYSLQLSGLDDGGYDRMLSQYDSVKMAFIRNILIFDLEMDFNSETNNKLIYNRLLKKNGRPVLEFDYINPSLGKVRTNGLSEEASLFLMNVIKNKIEEEKKKNPDHVKNVLAAYFRSMILKSISEIDIKDILKRSECDSVVVRLKESLRSYSEAASLGFNLTDSLSYHV